MENKESKSFDKILKENLEELFLPISEKWLGFKIIHSKPLPEKLQVTLEREPDFIRIVETDKPETFILHLEFQSTNDPEMLYRQAEYKAILQRKYKLPVRQFVIYMGSQPLTMKTQLPENQQIIGFDVYSIQASNYERLMLSDVPQEIVLAILGDFHGEAPEKVIRQIVARLQKVSENKSQLELEKYVRQLNVLSGLRKLQTLTTKITAAMPILLDFDIETDRLYKRGVEQGIEQGVEQIQKSAIVKMLEDDILTMEQIAAYLSVSVEMVEQIKAELEELPATERAFDERDDTEQDASPDEF